MFCEIPGETEINLNQFTQQGLGIGPDTVRRNAVLLGDDPGYVIDIKTVAVE